MLNSNEGDFYRVGFLAKSLADEKIYLKVVSEVGEEQEINSFDLKKNEDEKYFETIFSTSKKFQNLIAYIKIPKDPEDLNNTWVDKEGIYLSDLFVSRLDAKNDFEAKRLRPTDFGQTQIQKIYLPDNSREGIENDLAKKNTFAGYVFEAPGDYLASVEMNLNIIGNGGKGKYALQIIPENAWNKIKDNNKLTTDIDEYVAINQKLEEKIDTKNFSAYEAINFLNKNGNQEFELPARLEKGQRYFIGLTNMAIKTDKNNYLKLAKLKNNKSDFDAYIALTFVGYSQMENGSLILTGAKIEDLGKKYSYFYQNNHFFTDYFDIFEKKGKAEFTEKMLLGMKTQKGNYFTYKFNTLYPFEKMRILAKQSGNEENYIHLGYSYDNKFWQEIPYVQTKNNSQLFDFTIQDNKQKNSTLFLKVGYNWENDDSNKNFGLAELKINAIMPK